MLRILLVSVKAGAGHLKAAEAVEAAFKRYQPDVKIKNVDLLDYSNDLIKYLYGKMYLDVVKAFPELYGYSYKHYASSKKFIKPRFLIDRFNFGDFFAMVEEFNPDILVATHFISGAVSENYRRKKKKEFKIAVTLTDYEFHPVWLVSNVDLYFTATEEVKSSLVFYGIPAEKIVASGIPIHPKFSEEKDRRALFDKYGLNNQSPVILISAGSFGVTPLAEVIGDFGTIKEEFQIMVVCGNNAELKTELEMKQKSEPRLKKVFGFVDFMDQLMALSDLLITKPGGITVSESIAVGVPMILIEPIPGQEEANADYLVELGAGVKARSLPVLLHKLGELIRDPGKRAEMSRRAKVISRPLAAKTVAERVMTLK
ncbi:MAG: MGDG synthase family glycosyltransferase [Thermodesulfobacteriota bacterium]